MLKKAEPYEFGPLGNSKVYLDHSKICFSYIWSQ